VQQALLSSTWLRQFPGAVWPRARIVGQRLSRVRHRVDGRILEWRPERSVWAEAPMSLNEVLSIGGHNETCLCVQPVEWNDLSFVRPVSLQKLDPFEDARGSRRDGQDSVAELRRV
jgi:hypothetical protein